MNVLEIKNVKKSFNDSQLHVLKDISLTVAQGEVVAIIGPSGSSKSTLLRSLNLLEEPTSGAIFFDGADLAGKSVNIDLHRQKMGMVFQHFNLFPHLTVKQNLCLAPELLKLKSKEEASKRAEELLARVGLSDKANVFPKSLSGGQQQRIAIARALAMDPDVILFDEPTSALDPEMVQEVLNVIRALAEEGRTMLLVTHEMNFARQVSSEVVFLHQGLVEEQGSPEQVFNNPSSARCKQFMSSNR